MRVHRFAVAWGVLALWGLVWVGDGWAQEELEATGLPNPGAVTAQLNIREPGFDASLRIRLFHDPDLIAVPPSAGRLFLVLADSARGRESFFVPTDMALELGETLVYPVEFEQTSDLFGQALGGRLRPGETQLGFLLVPGAVDLDRFLPHHPDSVVIRYAHHRAPLRPVTAEEAVWWESLVDRRLLATGLNAWWEWAQAVSTAPEMGEGEAAFLVERLFPGQGHIITAESMSVEALRSALLRVHDRRLLEGPARQRMVPRYPLAARQAGISGLVIALCYVSPQGVVEDALVLASNTVHLLNVSALSAAMEWRFARAVDETGTSLDGWRLLPFQFRLEGDTAGPSPASGEGDYQPPRIAKGVEPEYPEKARNKRIEGTVVYRVTVDERGKLVQAVLEQGVHPLVDDAALLAVEQSLYVPATRNGTPIRGELLMPFRFGEEK